MLPGELLVELDDGARLWTVTEGAADGLPVVWCHGGPGGTDMLAPVAVMLTDIARVHRYEQRACGRSSGGPPFTMARWVADLDALRRHWGHRRWVVGGHSFGAALALAYGLEHPDATVAVVYLSCVVRLDGQPDWYEQYRRARLARMPPTMRRRYLRLRSSRDELGLPDPGLEAELRQLSAWTDFANPRVAQRFRQQQEAEIAVVNGQVNRELGTDFERFFVVPALRQRLHEFDVPVLLVHGAADPRPVAAVHLLATELPRRRLVVLDDVGHVPYWEAPETLRDVLRDFLLPLTRTAG